MPQPPVVPSWNRGFARSGWESEAPAQWQGLVGWWPIFLGPTGNTFYDHSGYGNHGTGQALELNADWTVNDGPGGWQIRFDGAGAEYISLPDRDQWTLAAAGHYSWCFWMRPESFTEWNGLFSQHSNGLPGLFMYCHTTTDGNWGPVTAGLSVGWVNASGQLLIVHPTSSHLALNTWAHVVVTYEGHLAQASRMKIYIDGIDRTDTGDINSGTAIADMNTTVISLGRTNLSSEDFQGAFAECRFYHRALTAGEVAQIYADPWAMARRRRRRMLAPEADTGPQNYQLNLGGGLTPAAGIIRRTERILTGAI